MRRTLPRWSRAQRPRRVVPLLLLLGSGCSNSAGPGLKFRAPNEYAPTERSTGCIDTPFIGPDHRSTTSGVQCGREASPEALLLRGRVVRETLAGLPGEGLEALLVSVHAVAGRSPLSHLPPAQAETKTDPQGAFVVPLTHVGEYVIAVRAEPRGPVLAARRVQAGLDEPLPELLLLVAQPGERAALAPE
ncbi:MAG: hypothetical protein R6X02_05815 [Enhygromyxa sp.]